MLTFLAKAEWSSWQPWSICTNECKQFRKRNCELNGIITDEKNCDKSDRVQIRDCTSTKACKDKTSVILNLDLQHFEDKIQANNETNKASLIEGNNNISQSKQYFFYLFFFK